MARPKPVILFDFIKRLRECGISLTGCTLQGLVNNNYRLIGLVDRNVQVQYGPNLSMVGHMTRGITVTGLSLKTKSGRKIAGAYGKGESIVIHFSENPRGW